MHHRANESVKHGLKQTSVRPQRAVTPLRKNPLLDSEWTVSGSYRDDFGCWHISGID